MGREAATFAAKVAGVKAWGGKPGIEQAEDVGEQIGDALVLDPVAVAATVVTGGIGRGALHVAEEAADVGKLGTAARKAAAKKATSKLGHEAAAHIDEAAALRLLNGSEQYAAQAATAAESKRAARAVAKGEAEEVTRSSRLKAKEKRAQDQARSMLQRHGAPSFEEPASEGFAKWRAKQAEKAHGKDARREGHDRKATGEGDRSKRQLMEDYE